MDFHWCRSRLAILGKAFQSRLHVAVREAVLMFQSRSPKLLVQLGLILAAVVVGAILLTYIRQAARNAEQPASERRAVVARPEMVVPAKIAVARTEIANARTGPADPALVASTRLMIPPPPGTEMALQGVDPRRLRASFERGTNLMGSATDNEQKISGVRLVNTAAILGYEPARGWIARGFPGSHLIQSAVTAAEAVRYSLDPLLLPEPIAASGRTFMVLLASYFSGRHELENYATYLLEALGDDSRLASEDHLKVIISELARVPAACIAVSLTVVKDRVLSGPECSQGLRLQIANFIRVTTPAGREAESRRQALSMLQD